MTDETLKELILKHDGALESLASSIEHLAKTQELTSCDVRDTIKKLEEISIYLTKQSALEQKVANIDKELLESFKRVHSRIDEIDLVQRGNSGCNSVRLLTKDIVAITKDVTNLVRATEIQREHIEVLQQHNAADIAPITIRWFVGLIIAYSIAFGSYVVQTFNQFDKTNARITALLERDLKDTEALMRARKFTK